jgi:hypothetical protein
MSQGLDQYDDALDPRWADARTLSRLGALVAEWLDGRMGSAPFYGGAPDPETQSITPVLQELNRSGFVTDFSQPGESDDHGAQRAAVCGYCEQDVAERLASTSVRGDLIVISSPAGVGWSSFQLPITRTHNCTFTILCGDHPPLSPDDDSWPWPGVHPELRAALLNAWYVSVCDPVWGRNDVLWPALGAATSSTAEDVRGSLLDPDYLESQGLATYG